MVDKRLCLNIILSLYYEWSSMLNHSLRDCAPIGNIFLGALVISLQLGRSRRPTYSSTQLGPHKSEKETVRSINDSACEYNYVSVLRVELAAEPQPPRLRPGWKHILGGSEHQFTTGAQSETHLIKHPARST